MEPLHGTLVVDFSRYLPGPYATRELLRLGARVVRVEAPEGDPLRDVAPEWDAALNEGKESVVWDLERDPLLAPSLCARADVVLEGFRPGVAARLGVGPDDVPVSTVYCSLTGFGATDRRAGHDLNYMGWAGALAATAPSMPPIPVADLAAGGLTAALRIVAALMERGRTGCGERLVVSMTHGAHELARFAGPLTGSLACYRIYETGDGRHITLAALEERFWRRFCELVERDDLLARAADGHGELEGLFRTRSLDAWLALFDGEDAMIASVSTLAEAAASFSASSGDGSAPRLGEHTDAWRRELLGE